MLGNEWRQFIFYLLDSRAAAGAGRHGCLPTRVLREVNFHFPGHFSQHGHGHVGRDAVQKPTG
jgi:hypothetical protein